MDIGVIILATIVFFTIWAVVYRILEIAERKHNARENDEIKVTKLSKEELLEQNVLDLKDKLLRNTTELANFKKRMHDERFKERKYASMGVLSQIVTVFDNLDRAVNIEMDDNKFDTFLKGFKMINDQVFSILKSEGVEIISAVGFEFDPTLHQSVATGDDENYESNIVLEEFQKGYKYKDRVLRPSMVKVNK